MRALTPTAPHTCFASALRPPCLRDAPALPSWPKLLLLSAVASLEAERDTLAARVATLERERAQSAELARRSVPGASARVASPSAVHAHAQEPAGWLPVWVAAALRPAASSPATEAALAAVRHHLVTVTTDRDLLASDLYRVMVEHQAAQRERDAALAALAEAGQELARLSLAARQPDAAAATSDAPMASDGGAAPAGAGTPSAAAPACA